MDKSITRKSTRAEDPVKLNINQIDQICKRAESELINPINLDYQQLQSRMIQASKKLFEDFS